MNLRSTATFAMGRGDNSVTLRRTFVLPHVLEKSGRLSVTSDNGNDTVTLDEVVVGGTTTIRTGAGQDTLTVGGATAFRGAFAADLGAGDDRIDVAQTAAAAPVTFTAGVTVLAGDGNDRLRLGIDGSAQNQKVVIDGGGIKWDGGRGINLFDPEAGQFELPAGIDPTRVFLNWTDPNP
jgi:Ca2+-binding RTX toxin-like protein